MTCEFWKFLKVSNLHFFGWDKYLNHFCNIGFHDFTMNYYTEISSGYEELHKEEQLKKLRIIKDNLILSKNARILDVGCGPCWSAEFFENVVGVDPAFELLHRNKKVKTIQARAEALPFKDHCFDVVLCVTAVHHFDLEWRSRAGSNGSGLTTRHQFIPAHLRLLLEVLSVADVFWRSKHARTPRVGAIECLDCERYRNSPAVSLGRANIC